MGVGPECAGARYRWLQAGSHDLRYELRDCVDCADIAGPPECQTAEGICGCDPEAKRLLDLAGAPGVTSFHSLRLSRRLVQCELYMYILKN